jgi:TrmH family RNA methyltransferase
MKRPLTRITSRQNPIVDRYRAVARGAAPWLLLDGVHLVADAAAADLSIRSAMVADDSRERPEIEGLVARLVGSGVEVVLGSAAVMAAVSPVRSSSPVVALADRPREDRARLFAGDPPLLVVACHVQDPGNLGAMIRVAEAGGATGLIAAGQSADPFGWKALRGSMGSALRLPVGLSTSVEEAAGDARRHGCRLLATIPRGGRRLFDVDLRGRIAVLIGGEGGGLPGALIDTADERVTIPMRSPVESLNAAVTAAVIVYEGARQRLAR